MTHEEQEVIFKYNIETSRPFVYKGLLLKTVRILFKSYLNVVKGNLFIEFGEKIIFFQQFIFFCS